MSYSDNAVMAKIRALYGNRLSGQDYNQLLQKKTVGEVASYLKGETGYAGTLREVKEDLIHRGQLENFIRRRPLDIFLSLLRYSYSDELFLSVYLSENEIEQLLLAMRLLNAGEMNHYIVSLPGYLSSHMSFDLFALAQVKRFDDLLEVLRHSPYYGIVGRFRPATAGRPIDIAGCETALLTYHYRKALELVDKGHYPPRVRRDLKALLYHPIDRHNVSIIYRMKRFYAKTPEEIRAHLIPIKTFAAAHVLNSLVESVDIQEYFTLLSSQRLLRSYPLEPGLDSGHIASHSYRISQLVNHRIFRFSTHPVVVLISYMNLLNIEVNNLTNIIEGIRYGVSPEEIRSLLAVQECAGA